ncbi:MAG: Nucleoside-triphosphatase (NTPase) [Candidatus Woesebacteria bacterium GW2011_GWB1_38_5b]|uniref:Nucleoside-triphosphatase (NTPase) n=1 Tax=Candidatus Woesebacteria bacterium GW2011_GWB1_38_5b TaxID=1618569 RepID=A0A0G0NAQ6_9BACT|nr:MAG: Nucleoside-triphosphatase (NTPase) [Candidatus Woesebacteria bacterium GW2011_GWB1_38_5b]
MKLVLLATSNERKIGEARLACDMFNIKIRPIKITINEIQSHNPKIITKDKAEKAFTIIKKPIVVTDTFWNITSLNGFPGGYMKDIVEWFDSTDFINLVKNKKDKGVSFTESIVYKDSRREKSFSKEFWGVITNKPRGAGNSIENVAEFDGVTLGERRARGGFSHKPKDYIWYDFAKWFSKL